MEQIEYALSMADDILHSKRKRHLIGGVMLSLSLFFAGLTVTILTTPDEENL